jgi:hypothetical protein
MAGLECKRLKKNLFFNVMADHGWHLPKSNLRAEKLGIDLSRDKPW